jgi:hypothetical protein
MTTTATSKEEIELDELQAPLVKSAPFIPPHATNAARHIATALISVVGLVAVALLVYTGYHQFKYSGFPNHIMEWTNYMTEKILKLLAIVGVLFLMRMNWEHKRHLLVFVQSWCLLGTAICTILNTNEFDNFGVTMMGTRLVIASSTILAWIVAIVAQLILLVKSDADELNKQYGASN